MTISSNPYRGFRFPREVIEHAVWLYHCFSLSLRDVELILAARGIVVSYESIREWGLRFGRIFANMLRQRRPQPGDKWYMCARPGRKCPRHPGPEPAQRDRSQAVLSQAAEGLAIRSAGDRDRQVQELRRRPARDPAEHRRARLMRNMPMARLLRWVSSAVRWPERPLRLQVRRGITQHRRRITHPMRRRSIPPCRRRSILTRRRLLRIMLRCRITGQGFTTAVTEERPIPSVPVQRFPLRQPFPLVVAKSIAGHASAFHKADSACFT